MAERRLEEQPAGAHLFVTLVAKQRATSAPSALYLHKDQPSPFSRLSMHREKGKLQTKQRLRRETP
jgi:hypothetical protein